MSLLKISPLPLTGPEKDPLLAILNLAIVLIRLGLIVGIAGTGFGLIINVVALGSFLLGGAAHAPPGASAQLSLQIILYLALGLAALACIHNFFIHLTRIMATVSLGTPFVPDNGERLMRMGWLILGAQMLAIPLGVLPGWIGHAFTRPAFQAVFGFSLAGLILALTMFVLARVFRTGTQMSVEIEGTV